eukprot:5788631-Prymnesium_polylepis.1
MAEARVSTATRAWAVFHSTPCRTTRYTATAPWRWRTIRASDMGGGLSPMPASAALTSYKASRVKPVILPATMRSSGGLPLLHSRRSSPCAKTATGSTVKAGNLATVCRPISNKTSPSRAFDVPRDFSL